MRHARSRTTLIVTAIAVGSLVLLAYNWLTMPVARPHVGDGRFANHSWRFPWGIVGIPVPGYFIDFPAFDLGNDFDATYHIEQLPQIPPPIGVYLSILSPNRDWSDEARKQLTAQVQIDVHDERGQRVCHVQQPLSEMVWASPEGGDYGLYNLDESFFVPLRGARYTLRVRYSPDPRFSGLKGFVHIRCGGSI